MADAQSHHDVELCPGTLQKPRLGNGVTEGLELTGPDFLGVLEPNLLLGDRADLAAYRVHAKTLALENLLGQPRLADQARAGGDAQVVDADAPGKAHHLFDARFSAVQDVGSLDDALERGRDNLPVIWLQDTTGIDVGDLAEEAELLSLGQSLIYSIEQTAPSNPGIKHLMCLSPAMAAPSPLPARTGDGVGYSAKHLVA